ncbi:MAG: hypothetical protein NTU62_05145 [Spirochaetes bacterium]|nr:hypothetical protein [Spirochaetota bacterium]
MKRQAWELKPDAIRQSFLELKKRNPAALKRRLSLFWSNWGFGIKPLEASTARLQRAGIRFIDLHLADSNHRALGMGSLDLDTVIRALHLVGHNAEGRFVTPEPLGPDADPYPR